MTDVPPGSNDSGADHPPSEGNLFDRAGEIFLSVRELGISSRDEAIDRACAGNPALKKIVLLLLRGDDAPLPVESLADDIRAAREAVPTLESAVSVAANDRIGNYKLLERIGEGGFGIVFMAEQERPVRRRVALKIIKLGMDTRQVVARFEAERQALALMDHPNIARVFDAGATDTGRPYFVMELVKGRPITEFCDVHRLTISQRLELIAQVCEALQHAHQRGVIHRDIKPTNVLVTGTDDKPVCKIIDFGIAKATSARLTEKTIFTEFRQMIGTPEYMSPEQAGESNQDVDTRTDVYATGVLLYELLTGSTPFDSKRLRSAAYGEMQRIIREEDPPAPSTKLSTAAASLAAVAQHRSVPSTKLAGVIKGELDWIVMKAIEKDRTRRYDSAGDLLHDIRRYLSGEAVHAAPPGAAYRAKKFIARHRGPVIAVSLLAFTLIAGLVGTSLGFFNAERQRKEAVREKVRADGKTIEAQANAAAERRARIDLEYQSYVANLLSASALLDNHQCGLVAPILAKCPPQLREWEWRWLAARADTSITSLKGHGGDVVGLSISADSTRIATAGDSDKTARVWDLIKGTEITVLQGHTAQVLCATLNADGTRVVTASADGTARVFDADSGGCLQILKGHSGSVYRALFSPDGKYIATASGDKTARIWNAQTGQIVFILKGHSEPIRGIAYSRDGTRIATASDDGTARLWDAASGEETRVFHGHQGWTEQCEFSPDGRKLLVRAWGPSRVWDTASGKVISELAGNGDIVSCASFNFDASKVVASCLDGRARIYDADTGAILHTLIGHQHQVYSAAFSPDGNAVVTASADRSAIVWNAQTGERIGELVGHSGRLIHVAFTPDGRRIATAASDHTARIWAAEPAETVSTIQPNQGSIFHSSFSPDSARVILPMNNRRAQIYSAITGKLIVELLGHTSDVWSAAFSPDGLRAVTGSFDKTSRVWDAQSGRELLVLNGHTDLVVKARFNPAGDRVATGSHDGTAKIWDADNGACLLTLKGHTGWVLDVNFSPDGTQLLTASNDSTAKLWNAASGELIRTFEGHTAACASAVFNKDGTSILTGSRDHTARIWDVATGAVLSTPVYTSDWIAAASFSPDFKRVIVSLDEGTAILSDPETSTLLTEFRGHTKHVVTAVFSPDGTMVLTTSIDGFARIWHSIPYRERLPRIERVNSELKE